MVSFIDLGVKKKKALITVVKILFVIDQHPVNVC